MRWTRALVLTAVVMSAGTLAHASAGGAVPGGFELAVLTSLCLLLCAAALGAQRTTGVLVALTVGGQIVVHTALGALAGHGPGLHADHSSMAMPPAGPATWWTHGPGELVDRPGMALAHLASAAAVGCWLALGEHALWALISIGGSRVLEVAAAARLVLGSLAATLVGALRRPTPPAVHEPLPQLPLWSRGPARRGPPAPLLIR